MVRLTVRDHGPGIPVDFKPLIFEKFAQADAGDARQKGGTGLGLSIVKQIVDRLSGEVGFADAPGGGTIFHVQLPCWDHVANLAIDRDAKPDAARLLLCEDDLDTALTLREQLRQVGFATDFAYSVGEALTRAAATQYHAILVDIHLPDGDGVSLIVRLRDAAAISRHTDHRRIRRSQPRARRLEVVQAQCAGLAEQAGGLRPPHAAACQARRARGEQTSANPSRRRRQSPSLARSAKLAMSLQSIRSRRRGAR